MKYLIYILMIISFHACIEKEIDDHADCPYRYKWSNNHYLQVPITVTPRKMNYHIGDTIVFSANFRDSIFDPNTDQTFKIEGFPFRPYSSLFRFQGDSLFRDGHRANIVSVPEENKPVYSFNYTDVVYAETKYYDESYHFKIQLILETTGRYVFMLNDAYNPIRTLDREGNEEANAIDFEGRCYDGFFIFTQQMGPDHIKEFYDELYYLDKNLFYGIFLDWDGEERYFSGGDTRRWQEEGTYCFEVFD